MYIPGRERRILEILLDRDTFVTVKELAEALDVSKRTIHRDLKNAETTLMKYDITLVKKASVGLKVQGTQEARQHLHQDLSIVASHDYLPEERQAIILASLFSAREPVKLFTLADELHVTITTISNDLDELEAQLSEYKLELIRKRGFGVQIHGEEKNKRQAISHLITKYIDPFELISLYKENVQKDYEQHQSIAERLLGLVQADRLQAIEKAVEQIKQELPYELADNAYIGLIVHLALAVERLKNGDTINFDETHLTQIEGTEEYRTATILSQKLEKALELTIPEAEIGYITMHLLGAKLRAGDHYVIEDSAMDIAYKAKELIQYVSTVLDVQLTQSATLLNDLVAHLKPAIYRMKKEMKITNPIIEDIERDYKELFMLMKEAVSVVFPNLKFPREEIGFLVLHFGSVLFYNESVKSLNALVVCSSGIGTAKILATQLQQQFPEITQVKNISMFELDKEDPSKYDIVFSTVSLADNSVPYILVSPILTKQEKQDIKQSLRKKLVTYKNHEPELLKANIDYQKMLAIIHSYTTVILGVLELFKVINQKTAATAEESLQSICADLKRRQYILREETVFRKLMQREKQGGLAIPETSIALYHTRTKDIAMPSFTVYRISRPLSVRGMHQEVQEVDTILMMLAPEDASQETLEVLSVISSLLIQNTEAAILFIEAEEEEIKQFLSRQLYSFLKHQKLM